VVHLGPRGQVVSHGTACLARPRRGRAKQAESGTFGAPFRAPMGPEGLFWGPKTKGRERAEKGLGGPKRTLL